MDRYEMLKNAIHCVKVGADLAVCEDCNLYECDHTDVKDFAMVVIEAVEKQIPKKVVSYSDDESDNVYCPCCNECIGSNDIIYEDFYYRGFAPMYCQECGQAMILR